jgi:hypothetical protein
MPYGTLKVDNITYTNAGVDASTTVSGLVGGTFPNLTITGTISGATITGNTGNFTTITAVTGIFTSTLSGATTTGVTANFQSGVFTSRISGSTYTGTTANFASGNFTATLSGNTVRDNGGSVRDIPQVVQTGTYTLVAGDAGDHIFTTAGVTVPSGVFTVGQAVSIYNNTTGNITVTQGTNVTLRQAGTTGVGDRTLAQRGLATVLCVSGASGTEFVIGGAGLS